MLFQKMKQITGKKVYLDLIKVTIGINYDGF